MSLLLYHYTSRLADSYITIPIRMISCIRNRTGVSLTIRHSKRNAMLCIVNSRIRARINIRIRIIKKHCIYVCVCVFVFVSLVAFDCVVVLFAWVSHTYIKYAWPR